MKGRLSFLMLLLALCVRAQTFEIVGQDTINRLDVNGQRQGLWRIRNTTLKLPDYAPDQLVEEVFFLNDKLDGLRKQFYPNGSLKSETTFASNAARGSSKSYYPNGRLSEEGIWINASWDGPYKYYYEDGTVSYQWSFKDGKREGEQKYFRKDGTLDYIGIWKDGKEVAKALPMQKPADVPVESDTSTIAKSPANASMQDQLGALDGYFSTKDKAGRIMREGLFRDGFLVEGKRYEYDQKGTCVNILLIRSGRVVKRIPYPSSSN